MCIEICVHGLEKVQMLVVALIRSSVCTHQFLRSLQPLLFAALMNRDEVFESIGEACRASGGQAAAKKVDKDLLESLNTALQSDSDSD